MENLTEYDIALCVHLVNPKGSTTYALPATIAGGRDLNVRQPVFDRTYSRDELLGLKIEFRRLIENEHFEVALQPEASPLHLPHTIWSLAFDFEELLYHLMHTSRDIILAHGRKIGAWLVIRGLVDEYVGEGKVLGSDDVPRRYKQHRQVVGDLHHGGFLEETKGKKAAFRPTLAAVYFANTKMAREMLDICNELLPVFHRLYEDGTEEIRLGEAKLLSGHDDQQLRIATQLLWDLPVNIFSGTTPADDGLPETVRIAPRVYDVTSVAAAFRERRFINNPFLADPESRELHVSQSVPVAELAEDDAIQANQEAVDGGKWTATIFYSWQSDLPNPTNRGFIRKALDIAAASLSSDLDLNVEARVESDTQGVPGSPDIINTILEKIDSADAVVADVSLVDPGNERRTPNPNVLFELGYAFKALGAERVLMVFNEAFGATRDLPFDLGLRRQICYTAREDSTDKAEARRVLAGRLETALRMMFVSKGSVGDGGPTD